KQGYSQHGHTRPAGQLSSLHTEAVKVIETALKRNCHTLGIANNTYRSGTNSSNPLSIL
ncbi:MAG: hypothetical protein JWQ09_1051, partial [Segetibacter sp.]|nr:hypothetical protein [Segetibacter sp.]